MCKKVSFFFLLDWMNKILVSISNKNGNTCSPSKIWPFFTTLLHAWTHRQHWKAKTKKKELKRKMLNAKCRMQKINVTTAITYIFKHVIHFDADIQTKMHWKRIGKVSKKEISKMLKNYLSACAYTADKCCIHLQHIEREKWNATKRKIAIWLHFFSFFSASLDRWKF